MTLLCCEATAHVSRLCSEWLGIIKAICCVANAGLGYEDLTSTLNVSFGYSD